MLIINFNMKDYIKNNILNVYEDGKDLSNDDFLIMIDVLKEHPSYEDKARGGVIRMWVETTMYGNKCFHLERQDGTKTDFSYLKCFNPSSHRTDYLKACRKAVEPIIIDFKNKAYGKLGKEVHVDHDLPYPFIKIARMFANIHSLDDIKIKRGDNKLGVEFEDKELEKEWIVFHNKYAKLRIISAEANLKLKKYKW